MRIETEPFPGLRHHRMGVAYRLLGSVDAAARVVDDAVAFDAVHGAEPATTELAPDPRTADLVRRCVDVRIRNPNAAERLPEPLCSRLIRQLEQAAHTDAERLSLCYPTLVVLQSLAPVEAAAWLLGEVYAWSNDTLAQALGQHAADVRRALERARHLMILADLRPDRRAPLHAALLTAVAGAATTGDLAGLRVLLHEGCALHVDAPRRQSPRRSTTFGADRVARLLVARAPALFRSAQAALAEVHGLPALLLHDADGACTGYAQLLVVDGRVRAVHALLSPDRLRAFALRPDAR